MNAAPGTSLNVPPLSSASATLVSSVAPTPIVPTSRITRASARPRVSTSAPLTVPTPCASGFTDRAAFANSSAWYFIPSPPPGLGRLHVVGHAEAVRVPRRHVDLLDDPDMRLVARERVVRLAGGRDLHPAPLPDPQVPPVPEEDLREVGARPVDQVRGELVADEERMPQERGAVPLRRIPLQEEVPRPGPRPGV